MKFTVIWYIGNVEKVDEIIEMKIAFGDEISDVKYLDILPNKIKEKVKYHRVLFIDDKTRVIDYGSYTRFILVVEGEQNVCDLIGKIE